MGDAMPLNEKLLKYIKRLASAAMPTVYSHKYIREQTKKAMRALDALKNAEDEIIEDPNAVTGLNSTLQKICYGPLPQTRTPPNGKESPSKKR